MKNLTTKQLFDLMIKFSKMDTMQQEKISMDLVKQLHVLRCKNINCQHDINSNHIIKS